MRPRERWALAAAVLGGLTLGLGFFTFGYARGASYLTNDPAACANCHVMNEQFAGWVKSSHRAVATCNDCHTPHDVVGKYTTKALNGFWHSFYFTTGTFPDVIRVTERNRRITERACRDCHAAVTAAMTPGAHVGPVADVPPPDGEAPRRPASAAHAGGETSCIRCHATVGHWTRD